MPFLTMLVLPYVLPAERLTVRRVMGTGVAFTNVVFVLAERGTSGGSRLGDSLVLLAAATWTLVIILSKTTPNEVNAVSLIFWNVAGATLVLALLTVIAEPSVTWRVSASAVASILYLGVQAAGVGHGLSVCPPVAVAPAYRPGDSENKCAHSGEQKL
jgi:drug/metabolite transporter (DMT)-like permease